MPVKTKKRPGRPPKAATPTAPASTPKARPYRPSMPVVERGDEWVRCFDRTARLLRQTWTQGTLADAAGAMSALFEILTMAEDSKTVAPNDLAAMEKTLYRAVAAFPPERFRNA